MDRKAIKREYKSTPRPMGVHQIKNRINGNGARQESCHLSHNSGRLF